MKEGVMKNSATDQFEFLHLMLQLNFLLQIRLDLVDISSEEMKSEYINSKIFVRPPREYNETLSGNLWNIIRLSCDISEVGSQ